MRQASQELMSRLAATDETNETDVTKLLKVGNQSFCFSLIGVKMAPNQ
jgi:hypothetical protein